MISKDTRPLTTEERVILQRRLSEARGSWASCLTTLGCAWGAVLPFAFAGDWLKRTGMPESLFFALLAASAVAGFCIGLAWFRARRQERRHQQARLTRALVGGVAEVIHCTAAAAVEIQESEDEGPGFFLDVGDGNALYLQGQYLYDVAGESFPNAAFEIALAPGLDWCFGVRCTGEPFGPLRTRPMLDPEVEYLPVDREIVPARLATLDEDLRRLRRMPGGA